MATQEKPHQLDQDLMRAVEIVATIAALGLIAVAAGSEIAKSDLGPAVRDGARDFWRGLTGQREIKTQRRSTPAQRVRIEMDDNQA